MSAETLNRREAEDRARRLDTIGVVLLLAVAVLQALSVRQLANGTTGGVQPQGGFSPVVSAIGGLAAAGLLVAMAIARVRRLPSARTGIVASLIVFVGLVLLEADRAAPVERLAMPLACLALLLVVLQRRGHRDTTIASQPFVVGAAAAAAFTLALLVQRAFS